MNHLITNTRSTLPISLLLTLVLSMILAMSFSRAEEERTPSLIPWPVKTILNLTESEQAKVIKSGLVSYLELRLPHRDVWIPVTAQKVTVITNEADPDSWARGIRLKDFRQAFPWVEEGVHSMYVLTELASGERIGELDKTFGEFYPNEEYFSPMIQPGHRIEREIDRMTYSDGTSPTSILNIRSLDWIGFIRIEQVLLHDSIKEYVSRSPEFDERHGFIHPDNLSYLYNKPPDERLVQAAKSVPTGTMTVKEYKEQVYEMIISPEHRPITLVYQKTSNTNNLPKLKDDILNSPKDNVLIYQIYKTINGKSEFSMIAIVRSFRNPDTGRYDSRDIFTDEIVNNSGDSGDWDAPYFDSKEEYDYIGVNNLWNTSMIGHNINNMYVSEIVQKMCWNASTVGEVVELYEQLPVEYQVDYSYFDFANSPNVDLN